MNAIWGWRVWRIKMLLEVGTVGFVGAGGYVQNKKRYKFLINFMSPD